MPRGCGQAFTSTIVSPAFEKQTSLKRHRLVNAALKDEIAQIHAWSAKCQTPAEWERDRAAAGGGSDGPPMDGTVGGRVEGVAQ
ncbi:BolA-like protein [Colletotrichum nymphaeae SA-01]|uniref:BolA-like protein n=1 Tax=Colletotrichum nymphaeae SA-01 TaxID=1460502 RepID=A0A135SVM2_9PEZI|nr:BolA-like protein [Colletotrichum nymphaeae SA-01]